MKYKNVIFIIVFSLNLMLSSCSSVSVKQIGKVNMISNRNVHLSLEYELISTYSNNTKLKNCRFNTIEEAIDDVVRNVPGGEFLSNVKLYLIGGKYFAVEGDVWGVKENRSFQGFKVGDVVTYKSFGKYKTGTIKSLKDIKVCLVETEDGKIKEIEYSDLSK